LLYQLSYGPTLGRDYGVQALWSRPKAHKFV
jgi:hypothetical protein